MSRYAAGLRDLAIGKVRDHQHRIDRFDEPDWHRYGLLVDTAFRLAAHRRFRPDGQDRAPVIRFVASVRERYHHTGYDLDPRLAESLLWATLAGEPTPEPLHSQTHTAQTLLLIGLLDDEGLSRAELDRFLADAEGDVTDDVTADPLDDAPNETTNDVRQDATSHAATDAPGETDEDGTEPDTPARSDA
ncbi:hypothetical protein [Plantactinospora endophytica]|uniref:hypothetical protein n=1 Tax=Plantactinospora endophytica TaxID=673535 RepID=UPI0019421AA0|nr:hypothetical protein [Plantactinospora endophytica]